MAPYIAACVYAACAVLPVSMQIALACGAPLGRFANGGKFPKGLPPLWRILALVQGALLVAMSWVVLARGGVLAVDSPAPLFWAAAVITVLSLVANAISPSRPERRLWTPVLTIMATALFCVAFL